jgi:hypothetical protein
MTPVEQHNANVAAAKTAIDNALEMAQKAEAFAGQHNAGSGIPCARYQDLVEVCELLQGALTGVMEAEIPVYDKAKEEDLYRRISFFPVGTDLRYELAKQLVAHMATRPKP